ncbi:MAG: helix-turn-helix transcriptional regulator [Bacteroidota bacterium]
MEYHTYPPDPDLGTLIKCHWTLHIPKEVPKGRQQVLSDGCMDLIFNFGDEVYRILPDETHLVQPTSFVLGQITRPMWIEPMGEVETFAVRFRPGSFSYFTRRPMTDMADQDTPLSELFAEQRVRELEAEISKASETSERISLIERFLLGVLEITVEPSALCQSVIDQILETKGSSSVKAMLQGQSNQRRRLEREFAQRVGTSPKQLCRAIRLQQALKTMLEGKKKLTEVGHENEYFDQAHFIKDFKDFTGVSPKEFYTDDHFLLSSLLYAED